MRFLKFLLMAGSLAMALAADFSFAAEATPGAVDCTTTKSQVPTCSKKSAAMADSNAARKAKQCEFRCRKTHDVWVCKGNGPQCNGKSPWD